MDPKDVNGRRVYQRNDLFDWTPENIIRMERGEAPKGRDGLSVQLYHLTQMEPCSLAEVSGTRHPANMPHNQLKPGESFRNNPELLQSYENYRRNYWKTRVLDAPNQ